MEEVIDELRPADQEEREVLRQVEEYTARRPPLPEKIVTCSTAGERDRIRNKFR